jgi:hypothetical protein
MASQLQLFSLGYCLKQAVGHHKVTSQQAVGICRESINCIVCSCSSSGREYPILALELNRVLSHIIVLPWNFSGVMRQENEPCNWGFGEQNK